MKKTTILSLLIVLALTTTLFSSDKYITYTQTFPWIGPDGEDPEVVFADLIEQGILVSVHHIECMFWYDGCKWQNDIGKIRNDCLYKIKVPRDVPNNYKKHVVHTPPNRDPTTIIVDINGTGNYTTIQEGIDNSVNVDTILVYPGTYFENINYNGKNITIASLYLTTEADSFIHQTIIDGNQNGSVVTFENEEDTTAVLCGFTIQNGSGTYDLHNIRGGGIFSKTADPKISDCIIKNNKAEGGAGIHCRYSNIIIENTTICNNHASLAGGGIYLRDSSTATFSSNNLCNIYLNYAGRGCDIETYQVQELHVIVDTFTVMNPDSYFALSQPENNFTFDILNVKIVPTNQDLYVSPNGDNTNSGLTQSDPLKIIAYALTKIASDSTHPNTIHLANGMYSPSITGEIFPLNCRSYVSIIGESQENTILDGNNLSGLIACIFGDNYFYIENLTIQNGHASVGGGLHFSTNSNPIVKNVTLQNNSASGGGAIMCSNNSNPIFEYVTIEDNYAESIGGGIYLSNSSPLLKNVIISNNSVQPVWGSSAGINLSNNSNPTLVDVLIANNTSDGLGSIIGNGINSCPILNNITVANNNIPTNVIYCTFNNNLNFNNCILFNTESNYEINFDESGYSNEVTISYTDIKNGDDGIQTNGAGTVNWLEGNIDSIPQFVGGDPFSYELSEGSPCIDAGNPDTTGLHLPAKDLAGNQRIYNGIIDIGAYEYQDTIGVDPPDTSFIHNLYLFQNTPNPFKESTTISFISADYERIKDYTLSIYNTKGQLVKRYYGSKDDFWVRTEIVWDGTDEQGKQVTPGTYFYKLEYNGHAVVRKMVLLR